MPNTRTFNVVELDNAEKRRVSEFMLENTGVYVSLDDVDSQTNRHIDTHTQLKEIKSRHEQELTVLYEYEANALHQDMLSTAASMEYADWPYMHPEDCELTEKLSSLDGGLGQHFTNSPNLSRTRLPPYPPAIAMQSDFFRTTKDLQIATAPARKRAYEQAQAERAKKREEAERKERRFPRSIEAYHAISRPELQWNVAHMLHTFENKPQEAEAVLKKYGWQTGDTAQLRLEYGRNATFKTEIMKMWNQQERPTPKPADPRLQKARI